MIAEDFFLSLVQGFDERALAELYDRHNSELYRYAWCLPGDADLAEDCVAETFSPFLVLASIYAPICFVQPTTGLQITTATARPCHCLCWNAPCSALFNPNLLLSTL